MTEKSVCILGILKKYIILVNVYSSNKDQSFEFIQDKLISNTQNLKIKKYFKKYIKK